MRSDSYSVIKDVQTWSGRITFHHKGKKLSHADAKLLQFAFAGQAAVLMDLLPNSTDSMRAYVSFIRNTQALDIVSFGSFLKKVDGIVKNYLVDFEKGEKWTYKRFKGACGEAESFWDFIGPISSIIKMYLSFPAVSCFRIINQYLNFLSRANMKSLDFTALMEQEYCALEEEMGEWTYPCELIAELQAIISTWTKSFSLLTMSPKHGPGSIAEIVGRPCLLEKYHTLSVDERLMSWAADVNGIGSFLPSIKDPWSAPLVRKSSLVCVPKSLTTNRTISKEPCVLQYLQQGVMERLVSCLDESCGEHIAFAHQEYSRDMAREGSMNGDFATIDLSAASDTVTVQLVRSVVSNPMLLRALEVTRSDATTLPSGCDLSLFKFAPMGSALCFPVETMVFAACCEVAVRREGGRRRKYRVYGDDIIISSECVEDLLSILDMLHFKVNKSKSFHASRIFNFREACGGEYYNSTDVAPLRIPRKFKYVAKLRWSDADVVDSYISFANSAFDIGYMTLRKLILGELGRLMETLGESLQSLPFSSSGLVGIKTYHDTCTNYGKKTRWCQSTFALETRAIFAHASLGETPFKFTDADIDDASYFEWLRRHPTPSDQVVGYDRSRVEDVVVLPFCSKLRYKWNQI